ncbi:phospholipase effector Tle1 domain-containing protein [Flavobacterium artemisiae]|uniref:Phospholipase effector Tle1 domain-containing protein n=1 Tax=Flavobacterium artemisiae TaxID=2126556 RepID=A0ABW4HMW2_9FLAO
MGKTFVYNTGTGKDEEKQDEIALTFGVFIDGTLNNKNNTDMRSKHSRGMDAQGKVDYSKGNDVLESEDNSKYKKIKNKGRIEDLLSKKDKTPAEQIEFDAIPERDKYLVASYRVPLNEFGLDRMGTDNSYSNDYTNVARMWQCCEKEKYAIYVPGMGTDNLMRDSQDGFAFGSGQTGIRARVRNACEQIADKVSEAMKANPKKESKISKIILDVFGFSRGAATARNLVYEVNLDYNYAKALQKQIPNGIEYQQPVSGRGGPIAVQKTRTAFVDVDNYEIDNSYLIQDYLPKMGHLGYSLLLKTDLEFEDLKDIEIVVRFVGIYDTVSSYFEQNGVWDHYDSHGKLKDEGGKLVKEAWSTHFNDDIAELHLNTLYCQKLVHFTAKDEHRQNFALTKINQIPGKFIEKNFPGVHCDIGGAYMTEKEVIDEIGTQMKDGNYVSVFPAPANSYYTEIGLRALRSDLIKQHWYREEQIRVNTQWSFPPYDKLTGIRGKKIEGTEDEYEGVKKEYSYIPLHFMETYARSTEMKDYFVEQSDVKFPLDDFLTHVESYLTPYALDETNEVKEWEFISDEEIERKKREALEKQKFQDEIKSIEQKLRDHTYEHENLKVPIDNLRVEQYKPRFDLVTQKVPQPVATQEPEIRTIDLPEVKVIGYNAQTMLRKLRNEYLHWSSTRDWFGMQPNTNRKRQIH